MRFCEYCGTPLEDDQLCTCPQAQQKQSQQSIPQPEPNVDQANPIQSQQPEPMGYGYGQTEQSQPTAPSQSSGADGQTSGYGYQQTQQDPSQSGYSYQSDGPSGQPSGGNESQQQPSGYSYQPGAGTQPQGQPGGQTAQQAQQQFAQMSKQVRDTTVHAAKSLKPFFSQYWTSPVQAVRTAVAEKNLILAGTMTIIRVVVVIALLWSMVGKVGGILSGGLWALSALTGSFGSRLSMTVRGALGSIGFGLLIAVLGMALFTLMLFVLTRIFKSGGSILDVYIANSVNGVVTTAILLLAFVCSLFSMGLGLGLVMLGCFAAVIFGSLSAQAVCGEQNSGLYWACYLAGVAVVLLISWLLMPNMVLQVVKGLAFG